jgi:dihydroorotate dehydrogenase electron transfer subunit
MRGELLGAKRVGAHHQLTLVAPGVAERFRPGTLLSVAVGGALSDRLARRALPIHRVRAAGAHGSTVEVIVHAGPPRPGADPDAGLRWLVDAPSGTVLDVLGPLGRPFALPREPVTCVLVGVGAGSAPLFGLADRLRDRGCTVHMLLGGRSDAHLFGALEARRATRGVTVTTEDGSLGITGTVDDALPDLLGRTGAEVVYAAGPAASLHAVAAVAERHGVWSQTMLAAADVAMPCGTGLCIGCTLPVVGEDGVTRMVRACTEGPVFRGDRVRWAELRAVPQDAR